MASTSASIKNEPNPNRAKSGTTNDILCLDQLPSEVLCPIVKYLPYKDRMKVTEVSTRWHTIVDERLGRKLFIGRPCQFTPEDEERYKHHYVAISNIGQLGVNTCYVGEIVDPSKTMGNITFYWNKFKESVFGPNLPKFKYPHLVKNIFFDGPIPSRFFESIVKPLIVLERLDIHLSALCCLESANLTFPTMSKLETLNIWGHKMTQGFFTQFYSSTQIIGNLLVLLERNHFPSLKHFAMEYPFDLREEANQVTSSLLDFLQKHRNILEKFKLCINLFLTEEPSGLETNEDKEWIAKAKAISKLIKLRNIELNISSLYKVQLSKVWGAFAETQNQLEAVCVFSFRLEQQIMNRLCQQNFRTLQDLSLNRLVLNENGRFIPVDCAIFGKCSNLRRLFIEAMPAGAVEIGIINVPSLPGSIENLELGTLTMTLSDTHYILTQLPNLNMVLLGDTGHNGEFGVSVQTVEQVIRERRIRAVSLISCINGRVPDEGISNGDPENETRITVRYYGMMEIKLNENGYYEPLPREIIADPNFGELD